LIYCKTLLYQYRVNTNLKKGEKNAWIWEEKTDGAKEVLDKTDKTINKGLTSFMTKTFMGKDFVEKANVGLDMAKQYTDYDGGNTHNYCRPVCPVQPKC